MNNVLVKNLRFSAFLPTTSQVKPSKRVFHFHCDLEYKELESLGNPSVETAWSYGH